MRSKKTYIIFLILLVLFFIVVFYFFGYDNYKTKKKKATLILGDNTIWSYNDKKWTSVEANEDIHKLDWKKYHIFMDGEKKGDYYLWHDDRWYAFDNNKNAVALQGELFAYQANYNIDIFQYEKEEITDDKYVLDVLADKEIDSSNFTSHFKVSFDFDNDGELEDFYVISNAFDDNYKSDTVFSIVFMVKNDKVYYIYEDISPNRIYNGCKPYFQAFLDTNEDGISEFILSCGRYSNLKRVDMLYQFVDNQFKILISN